MKAMYQVSVGNKKTVQMTGDPDKLDEIISLMAAYGPPTTKEEEIIRKIARYMVEESFGPIHLKAIMNIVVMTNWDSETEAKILELAYRLQGDKELPAVASATLYRPGCTGRY